MRFSFTAWIGLLFFAPFAAAQAPQSVQVTPSQVTFVTQLGAPSPPSQTVQVQSSPPGALFTTRIEGGLLGSNFLQVSPANGSTPATLTLSVDNSRFVNNGVRTVNLVVTLTGTDVSASVPVRVEVGQGTGAAFIGASPGSFSFVAPDSTTAPPAQTLTIRNLGSGVLNYTLAVSYGGGAQGWLQLTPAAGQTAGGAVSHQISTPVASFPPPGMYTAEIRVQAPGATNHPLAVGVTLRVQGAEPTPVLTVAPGSLLFSTPERQVPAAQQLQVENTGGGALAYQIGVRYPENQPAGWLQVTPPTGQATTAPVLHAIEVLLETLPPQGTYSAEIEVTAPGAAGSPAVVPVTLQVNPDLGSPVRIFASPPTLDFSGIQGLPLRQRRLVRIVNTPLAPGGWTARVATPNSGWLRLAPSAGAAPGTLEVAVDTAGLGAGEVAAQIEISPADTTGPPGQPALIPVRLALRNQEPRLAAAPDRLLVQTYSGDTAPHRRLIEVQNAGGPELNWTASADTETGEWLAVEPEAGGPAPTAAVVTLNASGLSVGAHHGTVRLQAGDQRADVAVTLVVAPQEALLETDASALYWEIVQGLDAEGRIVRILNRGVGAAAWTAAVREWLGASNWLSIAPGSGTAAGVGPASPQLIVDPSSADLAPGVYGALIELRTPVSGQPARLITATLRVVDPAVVPPRAVEPGGLLFRPVPGGSVSENVIVRRNRGGATTFQAAATTSEGSWLSVTPATGQIDAAGSLLLTVEANPAGLAPGVYRGGVSVTFNDGTVETVNVTLAVPATAPDCSTAAPTLAIIDPPVGFRALSGRAKKLEAAVVDGCGEPLPDAAVTAFFSNDDPALPFRHVGGGRYSASWTPGAVGAQTNLRFEASAGTQIVEQTVIGSVEGGGNPTLSRGGLVEGASFRSGAVAPGSIVTAFGSSLLRTATGAEQLPLPTSLEGLSLILGDAEAPLFFSNFGQVNAQLPATLRPASIVQAVVKIDEEYSAPIEAAVGLVRPSVFVQPTGGPLPRAIVQNPDGSLNGPGNPARPGDVLVVYLTGIGPTENAPAAGEGAPSEEPLARATLQATATLGGTPAQLLYLGLAPTFVGLGQANVAIPANAPAGDDIPLSITIGGLSSNPAAVAIGEAP